MFILNSSYWSIKQTPDKNKGVFAEKNILAGTVVGDYLGKIIDSEEEDDTQAVYSMYYRDNASIMPNLDQVGIHLFNHSCMPNCCIYPYQGHILITTLRQIFAGEELTFVYYLQPDDSQIGPLHSCLCHTPFCHGTMYATKEKSRQQGLLMKQIDPSLLKLVSDAEFGKELTLLPNYPQTIPDVTFYDLFGSLTIEPYEIREFPSKQTDIRELIRETGRCLYVKQFESFIVGVMNSVTLLIEISKWHDFVGNKI